MPFDKDKFISQATAGGMSESAPDLPFGQAGAYTADFVRLRSLRWRKAG